MKTFLRIAEVWTPTDDGTSLELSSGLFPDASAFEAITRQMLFARGEGLPGRAWEAGHPLMMRELSGSYFKRAAAAKAIDLTCAVACPVFRGDVLLCVIVLLMGGAHSAAGSVELWRHDPRISSDMTLQEGFFGTGPQSAALEALTREGWLPRGAGAPGLAWQKGETVCIPDIASSRSFLRKEEAMAAGIGRALAVPCSVRGSDTWVLALLSSPATPIARQVEVWSAAPGKDGTLQRTCGFSEASGPLPTGTDSAHQAEALGAIGEVWRTAVAQAGQELAGGRPALVMPVLVDDAVSEVVVLQF